MNELREAMELLLAQVDYTAPALACTPCQPVCEVLSHEVIKKARKALEALDAAEDAELNGLLKASLSIVRKSAEPVL